MTVRIDESRKPEVGVGLQKQEVRRGGEGRGGILTERDALACRWVCEQGVMTVDQLWRACWWSEASTSARYAYERVGWLTLAGFLEAIRSPYSLKRYFKATRQGQEAAETYVDSGRRLPVPLAAPRINEIPHADVLTELRIAVLRARRSGLWISDRVLALDEAFPRVRFYEHIPDAIWTTPSGRRIAVEFERTRKGITRLRKKVEAFSREIARPDRVMDLVLWVSTDSARSDLEAVLRDHPEQKLRSIPQFMGEIANGS